MTNEIVDKNALQRLFDIIGGDQEDFDDLMDEYLSAAPELAAKIARAAGEDDFDGVRIAAHTLKSNARDFGAMELSALCETLEQKCRDGDVGDINNHAQEILVCEGQARNVLKTTRLTDPAK